MTTHGDAVGPSALSAVDAATQEPAGSDENGLTSTVSTDAGNNSDPTEAVVSRQLSAQVMETVTFSVERPGRIGTALAA